MEEKQASARQKTLERELEWIRLAPRARQAKSKARINAYEQMSKEQFEEREQEFEIQIPPGKHLGGLVVEMKNVSKGYGDQVLMENLSFRLPPGGIVGVIGPNGAGKTTLFRMIIGEEKPDKGEVKIGDTVELGYVDQNRDALTAEKTVYEEISGGTDMLEMGGRKINSRAYLARFNFTGPTSRKKSATSPAANATACTWPNSSAAAAICCCSTNRPTISTSIRCGPWKKRSSTSPAAWSSSATTAGSWTASPRTLSPSKATATSTSATATSRPMKKNANGG